MAYWRMQLHPADPDAAMRYAVESIAVGLIGLDFDKDLGDLRRLDAKSLPEGQEDFWDFAHTMTPGDKVLVEVHHFPFALVTVAGDYNYIREPEPRLGVWFRHFRAIERKETRYYADLVKDARKWEQITMTDTISILKDPTGKSFRLIASWK